MSDPVVVKVGTGYRVTWDPDEDILRVWLDRTPEPEKWLRVGRFGIDVGILDVPAPERTRFGGDDPVEYPSYRVVALRMREASQRPELSPDESLSITLSNEISISYLNMLRHGHAALMSRPGATRPPTVQEAADRLAEAVRVGLFGTESRTTCVKALEEDFTDSHAWIRSRLDTYERARGLK